jgi:hypothetical protein
MGTENRCSASFSLFNGGFIRTTTGIEYLQELRHAVTDSTLARSTV